MWHLKAENFFIALGLVLLYMALPSLSYQVRLGLAQPLAKQHSNEALVKADPADDFIPAVDVLDTIPEPIPHIEKMPVRHIQVSFLPFISTVGNSPASGNVPAADGDAPAQGTIQPEAPAPPEIPVRLLIPAIGLDAPVIPARTRVVNVGGQNYRQWMVPNQFAVGWHKNSARLGEPGNTVLNGHHNVFGQVFVRLVELRVGDIIQIASQDRTYRYVVTNRMILPETYETLDVRMNNARWILPSEDERITLITCWPYESNTHRLIIVAKPSP